jgi:hypothetical protein
MKEETRGQCMNLNSMLKRLGFPRLIITGENFQCLEAGFAPSNCHQRPFSADFSLNGTASSPSSVPEFSLPGIAVGAIGTVAVALIRRFHGLSIG